uniref:LAGLIDADG homing endonuclease n=1 Tax=Marophrys sp. SRT127 TaxID=2488311 RepID=A0A455REE3_9EUKA|nr:LAGLIDADG homing endonuclease [Marophrys sp. SRT127]
MTLNDEQKQVLIGTLLGDGHLETRNDGKTYRFKFAQSNLHKAYLFHVLYHHVFRNLTLTAPKQKANGMWYFNTIVRSSACFRPYAEQFYGLEKGVPQLIDQWLTPKVLAYWPPFRWWLYEV